MPNKNRQPVTQKAVGNPNKGKTAATITVVSTAPDRLLGKPIKDDVSDES